MGLAARRKEIGTDRLHTTGHIDPSRIWRRSISTGRVQNFRIGSDDEYGTPFSSYYGSIRVAEGDTPGGLDVGNQRTWWRLDRHALPPAAIVVGVHAPDRLTAEERLVAGAGDIVPERGGSIQQLEQEPFMTR